MRFFRKWLVPIIALLMLIGLAIAFIPLSARENAQAKSDLTELANTAFERIASAKTAAEPVVAAEQASLLDKARAVARFLEHDDALLATDALAALCEQLSVDRIDVADAQGTLIASSDAARVGAALGTEAAFAWTMDVAGDPTAAVTRADETDRSLLYCCLPRTDIEGFLLLTLDDKYVDDALAKSSVEALIADLPYGGDLLFQAETGGADGFFTDSGNLCYRSTSDGVTLIAARQNARIYDARNTALVALAAMLLCVMICGVAAYLLQMEFITVEEAREPRLEDGEENAALEETVPESAKQRARRVRRERPADGTNETEPASEPPEEDALEREREHEQALENAPRQAGRAKREHAERKPKKTEEPSADTEDPFDKIVD